MEAKSKVSHAKIKEELNSLKLIENPFLVATILHLNIFSKAKCKAQTKSQPINRASYIQTNSAKKHKY